MSNEEIAISGLSYSFLMIFLAEIGDKTFILVMLYTTKMNNLALFIAASLSLGIMHVLGALCGKRSNLQEESSLSFSLSKYLPSYHVLDSWCSEQF